ncbi:MAG: RluA family pseudouridine synthase [Chlamydiales bacterium]|nr:RluA family pseudouridine synthase [Chlamydiales bacterium]
MKKVVTTSTPLLVVLKDLSPDSSNNTLRSWIEKGRVCIDGKRVQAANRHVLEGEEVAVGSRVEFARGDVKILFEDQHLVVVEKPAGLLSVATDFHNIYTVHTILKQRRHPKRVFPVHRLDRGTSGVMVFAYTEAARAHLKEQFEKRLIKKVYIAIVEGKIPDTQGVWESFLQEDSRYFVSSTASKERGKLATTHYLVLSQKRRYTRLQISLETGRKNQIRVHCSEAGFPIAGDKKYGALSDPIKRMCLHAQSLSFTHPHLEKKMEFQTQLPSAFDLIDT